jgi:hypothetical protein
MYLISPSRLLEKIKISPPSLPDPIRRQKEKEDKWRSKIDKEASWWDQINLFVSKGSVESSLGNLFKSKKHAQNDVQKVNEWKNNAIDKFLGAEKPATPQILNRVHVPHSPGHFERKYGMGKKNLPPLDLPTRNRICEQAKICKAREEKNRKYRKQVFSSIHFS